MPSATNVCFTLMLITICNKIIQDCSIFEMTEQIFSIGQKVRVNCFKNLSAHLGIISSFNTDKTYDIIYDRKANSLISQSDEELSVCESRISAILTFETLSCPSKSALESKEYGNTIFKLKDYDTAISHYKFALDLCLPRDKV